MNKWIVLDVASSAIENCAEFIDKSTIEAPERYVNQDAIDRFVEKEYANRLARAGLDLDLARLTAVGLHTVTFGVSEPEIYLCHTEAEEIEILEFLAPMLSQMERQILCYNGFSFDLPLLMRRARYLGVKFPKLNLDRYKSPHTDLLLELSDRDPSRRRSLEFYKRRLGWTDCVKPLSGEEEAQVHATGRWDDLKASVAHDVEVTRRLAGWLRVI